MLKKSFRSVLVALVVLSGVVFVNHDAVAQASKAEKKEAALEKKQTTLEDLGVTQDQLDKIKNIKADFEKSVQPLRAELREKDAKLNTAQTVARPDMTAVYKMIDDMVVIKSNIEKKEASMHQEIRKLLTDDQRIKYDSKVFKNNAKGHQGKGKGKGKGKGGQK